MVCFLAPVLARFLDLAAGLKPASCFSPPSPDEICLFFTHRLSPLPWFGRPLLLTLLMLPMLLEVGCRAGCQSPSHTPNTSHVHPSICPSVSFPHSAHHCPPAFCCRGETSQTSPEAVVLETHLTWAGGQKGQEPPIPAHPPHTLASHLHRFCVVFNTANVYHLPNRLDRFCFLSSGGGGEAPPVAKEPPPRTVTG